MTQGDIGLGAESVISRISDFDYTSILGILQDDGQMVDLYRGATSNYEKLHIFRILVEGKKDVAVPLVINKFVNESFHVENDYIFQLDPRRFQTVPEYVIDLCDATVAAIAAPL